MTNLILTGGERRKRSIELVHRLDTMPGRHWLIAVPCGLPKHLPDGIDAIGLDDLDGALGLLDRIHGPGALAVESVDYWCLGASTPIPNPDNNPRVAAWNKAASDAARKRARFRHAMQGLADREPDLSILLTATTRENAVRLLGEYPMGVSAHGCEYREAA